VNRAAQQGRLDDAALLQRPGQRVAREVAQAGPQTDVGRRCVLGLEPTDAFERLRQGERRALQEELASEQRPIELPCGQDTIGCARLSAADRGDARGLGVLSMEKDQIPTEQGQQGNIWKGRGARLDFDGALRLHEAVPALEPDQWLILLLPDPLGLPEVGGVEADAAAIGELQGAAACPTWLEDGDIGIGPRDAHGDARMPEPLPLECPVMGIGLRIGEAASLKAKGANHLLTGTKFMIPLAGVGLDPEKFLARGLGNGPHAASLENLRTGRRSAAA
jgi:hypothetical protein